MYCLRCNFNVPDSAKFCPHCGAEITKRSDICAAVPLNPLSKNTKNKSEKAGRFLLWLIIALSVIAVIFLCVFMNNVNDYNQTVIQENEAKQQARSAMYSRYGTYSGVAVIRQGENSFYVECNIEESGDLYSCSGDVSFILYDNGTDEWETSSWNDTITYNFRQNDNYYYVGLSGGNIGYLLKFISINENTATLKIYSYSMGHYGGPDSFGQDTKTISLRYDDENRCFTFNWVGNWRLYPNRLERDVGVKMSAQPTVEFEEEFPVDPNNYWWYSKARSS